MAHLLIIERPCSDTYYPDYHQPVWVGAEAPSEEVINELWAEHTGIRHALLLVEADGMVDLDKATRVRPLPVVEWTIFASWDGCEPVEVGNVWATSEAEAIQAATSPGLMGTPLAERDEIAKVERA